LNKHKTLSVELIHVPRHLLKHLFTLDMAYKREFCGFFTGVYFGKQDVILHVENFHWVTNLLSEHQQDVADYRMDPQQMMNVLKNTSVMDLKSKTQAVSVHNHPHSVGIPSVIDSGEYRRGNGHNVPYLIWGGGDKILRGWKWNYENDGYTSVKLEIHE